jgi:hypothetical protein
VQDLFWKAGSHCAGKEILIMEPCSQEPAIRPWTRWIHTLTLYFLKIHFNIILCICLGLPFGFFSLGLVTISFLRRNLFHGVGLLVSYK